MNELACKLTNKTKEPAKQKNKLTGCSKFSGKSNRFSAKYDWCYMLATVQELKLTDYIKTMVPM